MPHYTDYRDPQYHNHPMPYTLTTGGKTNSTGGKTHRNYSDKYDKTHYKKYRTHKTHDKYHKKYGGNMRRKRTEKYRTHYNKRKR